MTKAELRALSILQRYADRKLTRARAANLLGCSERQVNRKMEEANLDRAESPSSIRRAVTQKNKERRAAAARQAKLGKITPEAAAKRAGCSPRTIYRYMENV